MVITTWIICSLLALYWFVWSVILTHAMVVTGRHPLDVVLMVIIHVAGAFAVIVMARVWTKRR